MNNVEVEAVANTTSCYDEEWTLESYDRLNRNKEMFTPTNFGCYMCLQNFGDKTKYEEHIIRIHKDFTKKKRNPNGLLELSYTLDPESNNLHFKIISYESNIVIERVILVFENFSYVNLDELPYHMENGLFNFYNISRNFYVFSFYFFVSQVKITFLWSIEMDSH